MRVGREPHAAMGHLASLLDAFDVEPQGGWAGWPDPGQPRPGRGKKGLV
jgi:hypothetical protein